MSEGEMSYQSMFLYEDGYPNGRESRRPAMSLFQTNTIQTPSRNFGPIIGRHH